MLDADSLGAVFEAGGQLAREVAVGLAPEEAQDVRTLKVDHGVLDQGRKGGGQAARIAEQDVSGPLGLIGGPVVVLGPGLEDLQVQGVQRAGDGVEGVGPVGA